MGLTSNPFSTRYTRPGQIPYRFLKNEDSFVVQESRDRGFGVTPSATISKSRRTVGSGSPIAQAFSFGESDDGCLPFASQPLDSDWMHHGDIPMDPELMEIMSRLSQGHASLIVGPHGTGKTTLLHSLMEPLAASFVFGCFLKLDGVRGHGVRRWLQSAALLRKVVGSLMRLPRRSLFILDGLEQLGLISRFLIIAMTFTRSITLLGTSHRPIWGMKVIYRTEISPFLIRSLADDLLSGVTDEIRQEVEEWISSCDLDRVTNLRDFWFELYDFMQPKLSDVFVLTHDSTNGDQ